MLEKRKFWLTAVIVLLLIVLAACSGGAEAPETVQEEEAETSEEVADDMEATGSESAGNDLLPTPITGPKVSPTRSGAAQLDLFFVIPPDLAASTDLTVVPDWLTEQPTPIEAQFGLWILGDTDATIETVDFTSNFAEITAVLDQSPVSENQAVDLDAVVAAILQVDGWRLDANQLLIVLVSEASALAEADLATISATAVNNNTAVSPILIGDFPTEVQTEWQNLADTTNGRLAILSDAALTAEAWEQVIRETLDQSLNN